MIIAQAGTENEASFGDEVLVQVTAKMEYGYCTPDTLSGFPVGGYSISVVAEALLMVSARELLTQLFQGDMLLAQIIVALEEWRTGNYRHVNRLQDLEPGLSQHCEWVMKQLPPVGSTEWLNFSRRVHHSALQHYTL